MAFQNPSRDQIRDLLAAARSVAVVGLSPKPQRDSHGVAQALQQFGYKIIPVRPDGERILNERVVHDLNQVERADIIDVFRAPEHVAEIVDICIAKGFKVLWLQEDVVNEAEAERARAAGITVVMDKCILKEWIALMGT
jgi:predicted CoA-binding protein